jgi:hypothetical protein
VAGIVPQGDILLACTRSGLVVLADRIDAAAYDPIRTPEGIREYIALRGPAAEIVGRGCVACGRAACTYRPLKGPLFVPRP